MLVNICINDSGGGIEEVLGLGRTFKLITFKLKVKIFWRVEDVTWISQNIVQKGEVEVQYLGRINQLLQYWVLEYGYYQF